jgi:hypothetical protein
MAEYRVSDCERCSHFNVCKLKEEYAAATKKTEEFLKTTAQKTAICAMTCSECSQSGFLTRNLG